MTSLLPGRRCWLACLLLFCAGICAQAQPRCVIRVEMANHNRYAYQTAEECTGFFHTAPWGNWGVNSNVGTRLDTDQFKGWRQNCQNTKVEWNSCSTSASYRSANYLNFPNWFNYYCYPANGYPFADSLAYNDLIPPFGATHNIDQFSPCGPNVYGSVLLSVEVTPRRDTDGDGLPDAGGCADLHGKPLRVQNNFLSLYELDAPDSDDLIQTLYFPDFTVFLRCTPEGCLETRDRNGDGWFDDLNDFYGPDYVWPVRYQNPQGVTCTPRDRGVPCKRVDATITVARVQGLYQGP